jgi:hypothetical protein
LIYLDLMINNNPCLSMVVPILPCQYFFCEW